MGYKEFRRRYERKRYGADVIFDIDGKSFAGTLKDISVGGAYVFTMALAGVKKGDLVTLNIPYTSGSGGIKRRAKVVWTTNDGFAVEFY